MAKKKIVYQEKYNKGVVLNDHQQLIGHLQKKDTVVELINAGKFDTSEEFITVKIIIK